MCYQYKDTNFQRSYPQVTKCWGIKHKKLSYFMIFLIKHLIIVGMKCLKSIQTIYFREVLDEKAFLKDVNKIVQ